MVAFCVLHLVISDDHSIAVDAWTISFSPDSRFLATGSHSGKINLFGVESGRKEESLDIRGGFTLSIAYVSISLLKFRSQTKAHSVCILCLFSLFSLYLFSFCFLSLSVSSICLFLSISVLYLFSFCFHSVFFLDQCFSKLFTTCFGKLIKMMFEFFFPFFHGVCRVYPLHVNNFCLYSYEFSFLSRALMGS